MENRKKKWGDRKDGIWLKDIPAMNRLMPSLMPNRADNEAHISVDIDARPLNEYLAKLNEKGFVNFFGKRTDVPTIQLADKKIVVGTNWPTMVNGKPAEFALLLDVLRKRLGYKVENC